MICNFTIDYGDLGDMYFNIYIVGTVITNFHNFDALVHHLMPTVLIGVDSVET